MSDYIGWLGTATALAGSLLLSMRRFKWSDYGFLLYIVSNAVWIAWALHARAWPLVAQNVGFMITSLIGTWSCFGRGSERDVPSKIKRRINFLASRQRLRSWQPRLK